MEIVMYIGCMAQQTTQRENRETLGGRLARLRKEQGLTQIELGAKTDLSQVLISDYERGRLQPSPDTLIKMANALGVATDELLGLKGKPASGSKPSLKTLRRLKKIEELPPSQQKALFKTIDNFLKGAEKE
ncbi:MAG: helix-turn-helix transcriptional regulator [Desulfofustis sp. PB-SRB1]|jgi:transcriptional regulator with XRE-family HTH domain|nr:helix-turn-helix transcriptional regulator [Desulfofustis sp. PB-SRB1]